MTPRRAFAIVLVFLAFGPALGAITIGILGSLSLPFLDVQLPRGFSPVLAVALMLPVSYMAGGVQAVATGAVAALALKRGRSPWLSTLVVAALGAIALLMSIDGFEDAGAVIVSHLVAAASCLGLCVMFGLTVGNVDGHAQ